MMSQEKDAKSETGRSEVPPLIQISAVHKTYFMDGVTVKALRGVDLTVFRGEFVAIMGASGSGKSTLMNILGCLDRPTHGNYCINGIEVSHLSKDQLATVRNRQIGFVFQGFNLLSRTSALENVEMPMIYANVEAQGRRERALSALASVGLTGRENHTSSQLSGGQQQRVAIARALVNKPAVILADEPTGNLDSHSSIEIMALFQALNQQGITIVLITHEPDIAQFAKRCVRVRDGLINSDELVSNPLDAIKELAAHPPLVQDGAEDELEQPPEPEEQEGTVLP
ncbi:MAG TPA: ABC transporter ATP-binding protein [Candidatus Ozemobacteraceae bacterium]|nr:ABC transporter ATP-binding protein [Candidatus Ozemobacteraceae bacterium]